MTAASDIETHYCAVHSSREATLRCNKCERWMCVDCAVQTPVGYRCRECVRGLEDKFFTARPADYVITAVICAVVGAVGGFLMASIGFLFVAILLGLPFGGLISELARRAARKRRGRYTAQIAAIASALGILSPLLWVLIARGRLAIDLPLLIFAGLAAAAVYARFNIWKR